MFLYDRHDNRCPSRDQKTEFYDLLAKYRDKIRTFYPWILEDDLFIDPADSLYDLFMDTDHLICMHESSWIDIDVS